MLILLQKYIYLEASDAADKETHIKLIIALFFAIDSDVNALHVVC